MWAMVILWWGMYSLTITIPTDEGTAIRECVINSYNCFLRVCEGVNKFGAFTVCIHKNIFMYVHV